MGYNFSHYEIAKYYYTAKIHSCFKSIIAYYQQTCEFECCSTVKTVQCMHYSLFFCNNFVKKKVLFQVQYQWETKS